MDKSQYCEAGSEGLFLLGSLVKLSQEPEFEDVEKLRRKKRLQRSPLPEQKHELFWEEFEGRSTS
jgi:hypothetical protein